MPLRSEFLVCRHCIKQCRSSAGLRSHIRSCTARRSRVNYAFAESPSVQDELPYPDYDAITGDTPDESPDEPMGDWIHLSDDNDDNSDTPSADADPETGSPAQAMARNGDGIDPLGLLDDISLDHDDSSDDPSDDQPRTSPVTGVSTSDQDAHRPIRAIRTGPARLSTASTMDSCMESFGNITGRSAGTPHRRNRRGEIPTQDDGEELHGFRDDVDLGLAHWLHTEQISKGAIDRLLKDSRLSDLTAGLSWKSADELRFKLDNMKTAGDIGNWHTQEFSVADPTIGGDELQLKMRYRRVEDAIRFFLQHTGFKDDLQYEPYRLWTTSDDSGDRRRRYTEMASGDWWWDTQMAMTDGATIVPLIVASDATQVTNHQGDLSAHAVYLSIGNLNTHARHSNKRPGCILLALLPIVNPKIGDVDFRASIFHECLRFLFEPMNARTIDGGMEMPCSDGWTRTCYPILAAMTTDYEEQVKLTGVRSNQHCTMCQVPPKSREHLDLIFDWRSHEYTQDRIMRQQEDGHEADEMDVHLVDNFAFSHVFVNIHKTMMLDLLHQLLKGILMHVLGWIKQLLIDHLPMAKCKRVDAVTDIMAGRRRRQLGNQTRKTTLNEARVLEIIDRRFAAMPTYPGMRNFGKFSHVKQWTGQEQKSILQQLLPVFVPLLEDISAHDAIRFLRATVDFIMLASYVSHDGDTIRYLEQALHRMNSYKECMRSYCASKKDPTDGHFNFAKWHVLVHYPHMIREYGSACNYDTNHPEHCHCKFVKDGFKLTNKKVGWEDQVMEYNRRMLNVQAAFDVSFDARPLTLAELTTEQMEVGAITPRPTAAVDVQKFFGWPAGSLTKRKGDDSRRTIQEASLQLGQTDGSLFREAVAVFIRESMLSATEHSDHDVERLVPDARVYDKYVVQFHSAIKCWKADGKDSHNPGKLEAEWVRCAPNWQGRKGNRRHDWIWVQNTPDGGLGSDTGGADQAPWDGKLPGQVRAIITVESCDHMMPGRWSGVLVDVATPIHQDAMASPVSGLTTIERMPIAIKRTPYRRLGGRRVYGLESVHHAIHVVPVDEYAKHGGSRLYINNTADWATYNTLWNPNWEEDDAVDATRARGHEEVRRMHESHRRRWRSGSQRRGRQA